MNAGAAYANGCVLSSVLASGFAGRVEGTGVAFVGLSWASAHEAQHASDSAAIANARRRPAIPLALRTMSAMWPRRKAVISFSLAGKLGEWTWRAPTGRSARPGDLLRDR